MQFQGNRREISLNFLCLPPLDLSLLFVQYLRWGFLLLLLFYRIFSNNSSKPITSDKEMRSSDIFITLFSSSFVIFKQVKKFISQTVRIDGSKTMSIRYIEVVNIHKQKNCSRLFHRNEIDCALVPFSCHIASPVYIYVCVCMYLSTKQKHNS